MTPRRTSGWCARAAKDSNCHRFERCSMGDVMNMWCMLPLGLFTFLWPLIAPALVRGPRLRSPVIFYICGILVTALVDKVMFFLWTMIVVLAVQLYCHDPQRAVT